MSLQPTSDKAAIGISIICALHCLLTPSLILLLPWLRDTILAQELFHQLLLLVIAPLSLYAAVSGCKTHNKKQVLVWIGSGVFWLFFAAFVLHDIAGEAGEKWGTVFGTVLLMIGHIQNFKLCKKKNGGCTADPSVS